MGGGRNSISIQLFSDGASLLPSHHVYCHFSFAHINAATSVLSVPWIFLFLLYSYNFFTLLYLPRRSTSSNSSIHQFTLELLTQAPSISLKKSIFITSLLLYLCSVQFHPSTYTIVLPKSISFYLVIQVQRSLEKRARWYLISLTILYYVYTTIYGLWWMILFWRNR